MASKKKKGNKGLRTAIFIAIEAVALCALIVVLYFVFRTTDDETGVQKYDINKEDIITTVDTDPVLNQYFGQVDEDYTTLAFFGVDARNGMLVKSTRTDTIILCSINNATGDVRLCSVYRDTYLNIDPSKENGSYSKCNAAYAYGGPQQAMSMLNSNLDLNISKYVTIGFDGVQKAVDAVGGVDIDIQQNEIQYLNDYQRSMYSTETTTILTDDFVPVTETGMQTLSGYQALAYCRIRYTAGNDFKRTERQRNVVTQIVNKAKRLDVNALTKICTDVAPLVSTNLDLNDEIIPMATQVTKYNILDSSGFPFSDKITTGMIGSKGDCVIPLDLEANVIQLHQFLYPGIEYVPSETVKNTSERIKSDTSPYIGQK